MQPALASPPANPLAVTFYFPASLHYTLSLTNTHTYNASTPLGAFLLTTKGNVKKNSKTRPLSRLPLIAYDRVTPVNRHHAIPRQHEVHLEACCKELPSHKAPDVSKLGGQPRVEHWVAISHGAAIEWI